MTKYFPQPTHKQKVMIVVFVIASSLISSFFLIYYFVSGIKTSLEVSAIGFLGSLSVMIITVWQNESKSSKTKVKWTILMIVANYFAMFIYLYKYLFEESQHPTSN